MKLDLDLVAYMQAEAGRAYMRRHGLKPSEFVKLDERYDILGFIEAGYGVFHMTGIEGVLDEIDDYVEFKRGREARSES
ncbi:MAG: DUF3791 domain-containing protein [Candidatus Methanoplasma sp.]|jgi:hypothetical protein|nr:DUF3791 domain-containing protein [Candidatus Methanoplasma sp.]